MAMTFAERGRVYCVERDWIEPSCRIVGIALRSAVSLRLGSCTAALKARMKARCPSDGVA